MVHIKRIDEMMTTDGDWDLDEIRIDFFDKEEKRWSVDVWRTPDDNEEGECVAYIYEDGRVEFRNPDAKSNAAIREKIAQFIRDQRKRPKWESRRANARGRALNEWGSFGDDNWVDFLGEISGLSELYKFDKLCPDAELTDDDVKDSLQIFGIDTPLTNIGKAYYDAIFKAFVREMQEEYGLSDDEVEKIEMSFNPVEFRFGNDYFTTKDEFEKILDKRRFRK